MAKISEIGLLAFLLRPVIRYCLRHSLHIQDLLEAAKVAFIEEAASQMEASGEKHNVSRMSIVTGIHRRDVMRIYREGKTEEVPQGLFSRILGAWQYSSAFSKNGRPRPLSYLGDTNEFGDLVKSVSSDLHPGTVFFEFKRSGLVEEKNNRLKLLKRVQQIKGNYEAGFSHLSRDLDLLTRAVETNLVEGKPVNLHGRTEFDNITLSALPAIKKWVMKEGSAFHQRVRDYLSQFDEDIHPTGKQAGGYVAVGAFSFTEERK